MDTNDALQRLLDEADLDDGPVGLSRHAWARRFEPLPTDADGLLADPRVARMDVSHRRALLLVCARRVQYGFANGLLLQLLDGARARDPRLVDAAVFDALDAYARCGLGQDHWDRLLAHAASDCPVAADLASTAAFVAADVPDAVCRTLLDSLDRAADAGPLPPVPAYRRVNLARRLGRVQHAREALDDAFASLLSGPIDPGFADHMSERLVGEALSLQDLPRAG